MKWVSNWALIQGGVTVLLFQTGCKDMPRELRSDQYFSGCQLQIYQAAGREDVDRIGRLSKECGVSLDAAGTNDITLLALAVINADKPAIRALVKAGADPFHVIVGAGSPAVLAINRHLNPPGVEALDALAAAGLDFNHKINGTPYLFYFVDYSHWVGLEFAIAHGANVNSATDSGATLLYHLTERQEIDRARWLLSQGADPALSSRYGDSPLAALEFAISRGDPSAKEWWNLVAFRDQIIARIANASARHTAFTQAADERIARARSNR